MKSVLVANQDIYLGYLIQRILDPKYRSKVITNAFEIFDELKENGQYSVLVADANLKLINANDLVRNLKLSGFYNHIPIILLGASDELKDRQNYRNYSDIEMLEKPFDPTMLISKIEHLTSLSVVD